VVLFEVHVLPEEVLAQFASPGAALGAEQLGSRRHAQHLRSIPAHREPLLTGDNDISMMYLDGSLLRAVKETQVWMVGKVGGGLGCSSLAHSPAADAGAAAATDGVGRSGSEHRRGVFRSVPGFHGICSGGAPAPGGAM